MSVCEIVKPNTTDPSVARIAPTKELLGISHTCEEKLQRERQTLGCAKSKTRIAPMRTSTMTIPNANISPFLLAGTVRNNSCSVAFVRLHTSKILALGIDASTRACPWPSIRMLGSKNVSCFIGLYEFPFTGGQDKPCA